MFPAIWNTAFGYRVPYFHVLLETNINVTQMFIFYIFTNTLVVIVVFFEKKDLTCFFFGNSRFLTIRKTFSIMSGDLLFNITFQALGILPYRQDTKSLEGEFFFKFSAKYAKVMVGLKLTDIHYNLALIDAITKHLTLKLLAT